MSQKESDVETMNQGEEIIQGEQTEPHIIQIIPAQPGWEAVYGDVEEPAKGDPGYYSEAVVCWALVEESDGHTFVTAMMPDLESSELKMTPAKGDFLGYGNPGYTPNWKKRASNKRTEKKPHKA